MHLTTKQSRNMNKNTNSLTNHLLPILRSYPENFHQICNLQLFSNVNVTYKKEKGRPPTERKHLLNQCQYFPLNVYKPTLNWLFSRMNVMYKKKSMSVIKICQFFFSGELKHFDKCKIILASKFKLLLTMSKFKSFSNHCVFKTHWFTWHWKCWFLKKITSLTCVYVPRELNVLIFCHHESVPSTVKTKEPNWSYSTRQLTSTTGILLRGNKLPPSCIWCGVCELREE